MRSEAAVGRRSSCRKATASSTAGSLRAKRKPRGGCWCSEAESIVAILLILATAFHSTRDALIIMLNLPLALVGGVAGVYFAGGVLSVASIIGFITLFGIATRNGIMLVAHIRHLQRGRGRHRPSRSRATGASERLAPILMTALGGRSGAGSDCGRHGETGQRDSGADGDGHFVRSY